MPLKINAVAIWNNMLLPVRFDWIHGQDLYPIMLKSRTCSKNSNLRYSANTRSYLPAKTYFYINRRPDSFGYSYAEQFFQAFPENLPVNILMKGNSHLFQDSLLLYIYFTLLQYNSLSI